MLKPSQGRQGAIDFIVDTVSKAGPNPCPPIIVGVGLGRHVREGRLHGQALAAARGRIHQPRSAAGRVGRRDRARAATLSASGRRGWAASPRSSTSSSRRCRRTSPACRWPSTSSVIRRGTRRWCSDGRRSRHRRARRPQDHHSAHRRVRRDRCTPATACSSPGPSTPAATRRTNG